MTEPDLSVVEALCDLQLASRRLGCRMLVHDAGPELVELITFAGLDDVLLCRADRARGRISEEHP